MTAQEIKDTARHLFKACQYAEAVPLLKSAAEAFPKDEVLWQELVIAAYHCGQHDQAVEFAKQGIRQHPSSGWLWRQLGSVLTAAGRLDEAGKALDKAGSLLGMHDEWLWRYLATLYQARNNLEMEIEALENLHAFGSANSTDLAQLGIAYHNQQNFAKAIEFYRLAAASGSDTAPLFNMGLVFSNPEVSQDADAADAYRRALALKPDYKPAKENLDTTKLKLAGLAERAREEAVGMVQSGDLFHFYVSPFEVFQIEAGEWFDDLDVKVIQRAKKRLMQEIDLNDGKISWLEDYQLDKSYALAIENELHDDIKRFYHMAVFDNRCLLNFLTRGDIGHFLYSDDYFPHETLELLEEDPGFHAFLSKPFARQYNFLLTRAIERRLLSVVEALFDGRRWVEPADEDICFEGAFKRIGELVKLMRSKATDGCTNKVNLSEMEDFLQQHSFTELFNLLPTAFASYQRDVVTEIRSLAISCFNEHGDSDLSKGVLGLCKRFTTRSVELSKILEDDFKAIERLIGEERKHESRLTFGTDRPFEITKAGIRDGMKFFPASSIKSLRWGITVTGYPGKERYEYLFSVRNAAGHAIIASWTTDKSSEEKQTAHWTSMVNAALNYLSSAVIEKIREHLLAGQQVVIGPCTLLRQGVAFQTQGLIFKKDRFIHWRDVLTESRNGQIDISSRTRSGVSVAVPMKDTDNAVLLPILSAMMEGEYGN